MKTRLLLHCLLLCIALSIGSAHAGNRTVQKLGSRSAGVERADLTATAARAPAANPSTAIDPAAAECERHYPHFRLIDLGTLGGQNSGVPVPGPDLNDRGEIIASASTGLPDPFPDFSLQDDGTIWHGILSNANGVVRDLGGIKGNHSVPVWISENGLIVGFGENGRFDNLGGFPQVRALFWDKNRTLHNLGTLGGNTSGADAVNNRAQVVGVATNAIAENPDVASYFNGGIPAAQQVRAFLWERGQMQDLGTLGGNDAAGIAMNEDGEVAGFSSTNDRLHNITGLPTIHPFFWKNGRMRDLGSLGGTLATTGSFGFGPFGVVVNEDGHVIGTSNLRGDEKFHAFFWDGERMIDLGTFGGDNSDAFFISDRDQVLGRAEVSLDPFVRHAFLWEKGRMTDLGAPAPCTRSTALSMNSRNQIVGTLGACTDDRNDPLWESSFYVEQGKAPVDLNKLIRPHSQLHLVDAISINERGEIAGTGILPDGSTRAVLLVPTDSHD
jgi:probable HAF family extracellular repeat protein